ncbi:hypothetical protein ASE66_24005 [Bosea sp. Root483D1]|uniref:hypothetical protein n=1 Tax=Bosea sp. Root483D1 TaxID=1736544 RepID=UPI00070DD5E5|nr:hypothetical protein [Bosea sp. Root483D1]KRE11597.1 hypothetical protein ASE66_24005 [Bosea sp. Root483D1]
MPPRTIKICVGIAFAACSITAQAADLSSRRIEPAAPLPPAFSWTGFYIGTQAGWAQTRTELTADAAIADRAAVAWLPSLDRTASQSA